MAVDQGFNRTNSSIHSNNYKTEDEDEKVLNTCQFSARARSEMANGTLKNKFLILDGIREANVKLCETIIMACAVLMNYQREVRVHRSSAHQKDQMDHYKYVSEDEETAYDAVRQKVDSPGLNISVQNRITQYFKGLTPEEKKKDFGKSRGKKIRVWKFFEQSKSGIALRFILSLKKIPREEDNRIRFVECLKF